MYSTVAAFRSTTVMYCLRPAAFSSTPRWSGTVTSSRYCANRSIHLVFRRPAESTDTKCAVDCRLLKDGSHDIVDTNSSCVKHPHAFVLRDHKVGFVQSVYESCFEKSFTTPGASF